MELVILVFSVFFATVPTIGVALAIWAIDAYEREPLWAVALVFVWGAFAATPFSCFFNSAFEAGAGTVLSPEASSAAGAVLSAPFVEEFFKGVITLGLLMVPRLIDGPTDGIVYGSVVGLGFAMTENLLYFGMGYAEGGVGGWATTVVLRSLFSSTVHLLASAALGLALGLARYHGRGLGGFCLYMVMGYVAAVTIHFTWNFLAVLSDAFETGAPILLGIVLELVAGGIYLAVGLWFVARDGRRIRFELEEEELRWGTLPPGHAMLLASVTKRRHLWRLYPGSTARAYARAGVRLAIAKDLYRQFPSVRTEGEIQRLREEIRRYHGGM